MAAVMVHKGHTVVGVDVNPAYVPRFKKAGRRSTSRAWPR